MTRPAAKRSLGQNFLVSRGVARRILDAVEPPAGAVLEIGPGRGALTEGLLSRFAPVVAVELDGELAAGLRERWGPAGLVVHETDVLALDLAGVRTQTGGAPLTIVGNLPYNVSKPIAMLLVRARYEIGGAVLMFQREVAQRLVARPGSRAYGPLTVLAGACFRIEKLFDVAPGAFRPRPGVVSSVTRWRRLAEPLPHADEPPLRACLAGCFARRRRTLRNNLRAALGEVAAGELLAKVGFDGETRAEQLSPAELRHLAALWPPES